MLRVLLWAVTAVVALIVVAVVALNIYLTRRSPSTTVTPAGAISFPVPFKMGRPFIDYLTVSTGRLYVGYASQGMVRVVDAATNQPIAMIEGLTRVHGVAIVPEPGLGFVSSSGDNVVGVFDLATNKLTHKIPGGEDPDGIIYDPAAKLVYVGNHDGKTAMLIDPATAGTP